MVDGRVVMLSLLVDLVRRHVVADRAPGHAHPAQIRVHRVRVRRIRGHRVRQRRRGRQIAHEVPVARQGALEGQRVVLVEDLLLVPPHHDQDRR